MHLLNQDNTTFKIPEDLTDMKITLSSILSSLPSHEELMILISCSIFFKDLGDLLELLKLLILVKICILSSSNWDEISIWLSQNIHGKSMNTSFSWKFVIHINYPMNMNSNTRILQCKFMIFP